MTFGADDRQSTGVLHLLGQLDVRASTRHVGGDGHCAGLASFRHHLRLTLVHFGVEHLVLDAAHAKHFREQLADFNGRRADQHRTPLLAQLHHVVDDGVQLLTLRLVDQIVPVLPRDGAVGRNDHHVQPVDVPKLARLRLRRSGHASQLVVHPEVILERHRGVGLRGGFHLHTFLGLDGLVQPVAVTAAVHDAAGLLVDDHDLVVHHHVLDVLLEQGVRLQKLVHAVDAGALDAVVLHELLLLLELFLFPRLAVVDADQFCGQIRHREEVLVLHVSDEVLDAFLSELDLVLLFVDHEEELRVGLVHLPLVVRQVIPLCLEELLTHAVLAQKLDEGLALGQGSERPVQRQSTSFNVVLRGPVHQQLLGVGQEPLGRLLLHLDNADHPGFELVKFVLIAFGRRSADDEWGPGFVDQHRVDLIDNGEVVLALHELFRPCGHVVPQVVEPKLVVGAERHVTLIRLTTRLAVGLVLVDAIDGQSMEFVEGTHPLGVATGEVVVDGHHMNATSREGVEEDGQRGHKGFSFPRLHLRRLAAVEGDASNQLHVVVNHVPRHLRPCSSPGLGPVGLVPLDPHQVTRRGDFTVQFGGGHLHIAFCREAARRLLHQGKRLWHHLFQHLFQPFVHLKLQGVDLLKEGLLLVQLRQWEFCCFGMQLINLGQFRLHV